MERTSLERNGKSEPYKMGQRKPHIIGRKLIVFELGDLLPPFWGKGRGGFISLFSCLRRLADALYQTKTINIVTSLKFRSSVYIIKDVLKNQTKNQKNEEFYIIFI